MSDNYVHMKIESLLLRNNKTNKLNLSSIKITKLRFRKPIKIMQQNIKKIKYIPVINQNYYQNQDIPKLAVSVEWSRFSVLFGDMFEW